MKKLLSWILVLALCLSLFPGVALAEDAEEPVGEIAPVEEPVPPLEEDGGLSGTPAPTEEDEAGTLVGDGVLDVPTDDPAVLLTDPAADEIQAATASGTCGDNLTWTLENGVLTISGSGAMSIWNSESDVPWYSQRESISQIVFPEGLTSIGQYAFRGCKYVASVTIPEGVTSIGGSAFRECSSLVSVTIPEGVTSIGGYALSDCSSLTSVTIPEGVTSIEGYMFYNCTRLLSVTIPSSVTSIGGSAFLWCFSLMNVTIPEGVTSIGNEAFSSCQSITSVTIPSSVTSIGSLAFSGMNSLASVTIPSSVTSIGYYAFGGKAVDRVCIDDLDWWLGLSDSEGQDLPHGDLYLNGKLLKEITVPDGTLGLRPGMFRNMSSLERVTLPEGLVTMGDAFSGCSSLVSVTIPESVTSIEYSAFSGCSSLTSVTIPESVTSIGRSAFTGCSSLASVTIPSSVISIGDSAFWGCSSLTSVTIPESVTSLGGFAFRECSSLMSVTIPEGVTRIKSYTFFKCSSLRSVTIPNSVTSIEQFAFSDCSILTSVTIPAEVNSIGDRAFQYCPNLKTVIFLGDAPQIDSYAFGYSDYDYDSQDEATALYPIDNETWTADKRQNYGGFLTWLGYRDEAKVYTIHYDPNGGNDAPADQLKGHGVDLALSDRTPSRANEAAESYTVTLDYNGSGAANGSLEAQRTASFSFAAWNTKADGSGDSYAPGELYAVDAGLDLYAQWGSSISTSRVYLPSPGRTGYSFQGWATTSSASSGVTGYYTPEKSLTLYAIWKINTYTVSYNANGGSGAPASQTKTYGVNLTLSDVVPTRTGYIFQGWSTSSYGSVNYQPGGTYSGNSNLTLYAVWKAETYTVHFDLNGGKPGYSDNDSAFPGDLTKTYGQDLRLSAYAHREGHRFLGWARDPAATEAEFQPYDYYYDNAPVTLYAVWAPYTFPVVYIVGKGAQGPEKQVKTWGVDLKLSDMVPTAEGYDFIGWSLYNQSNIPDYQPGDVYTGNGNGSDGSQISFYAIWQLKIYLVTYKANGGEDAPAAQLKTHGRSLTLSSEAPYREGYRFLGWSTNKWSTEAEYQPGDPFTANKDTTLYALWEKKYPEVPTGSVLALTDAQSAVGYDFTVDLTLDENPGVMMISFKLDYDKDALEFLGGEDGALTGWYFSDTGAIWDNSSDSTETGCLAKLNFHVKEGADTGRTEIYITDLFTGNFNEEALIVDPVSSTVNIVQRIGGDVNNDGSVNGFDLIRLRKYLAGMSVEISPVNADATCDGLVDILDLVRLRKHLAGVNVDLG